MFQKAEVLYFVFFVTRSVKLGFLGFWQVESEPRKPKIVKIQLKMISQASEGDLMCLGSLSVPLFDSSCTKTRSSMSKLVHMHVMNLVIICITKIITSRRMQFQRMVVAIEVWFDAQLVWGSRVWDKVMFGWVFDNLRAASPCNNFYYKIITKLLHRILTPNVIFIHQIDWKRWLDITMHTTRQWELLGWCFEKTWFSFWLSLLDERDLAL